MIVAYTRKRMFSEVLKRKSYVFGKRKIQQESRRDSERSLGSAGHNGHYIYKL